MEYGLNLCMKRIIVFLTLAFLTFSCSEKKEEKKSAGPANSGPLSVEGYVVGTTSLSESIEVAGNILPYEITEIRPEISGRIIQLNFKEGGTVPQNTVLVKIFDGDLQAQLKKLEVQLQIAEKTEERQRELLKISGISQQDYDLSLLQVNNIKADIELTKVNIAKTEIRSPYPGRMGLRQVSLGAYITPASLISTISQVDRKKISFSIPEKYGSEIKPGMFINFTVEGTEKEYRATILASETTIESETRNLKILATVNDASNQLIPGSFAKVSLDLGKKGNAMMVPSSSILPGARNKQLVLFRNGSPEFVEVTTGIRTVEQVEITKGIMPGDTVITTGLLFIRKDTKLKLNKVQ